MNPRDLGKRSVAARRERSCREALAAFPAGVSYASKAFTCRAMAALAHDEGLTLDVASAGEFLAARRPRRSPRSARQ